MSVPTGSDQLNYLYCFVMLGITNAAGFAFAQLLAVSSTTAEMALSAFPVSFLFLALFSGYPILLKDIPLGWKWGRYVSFARWSFQGMVAQIFGNIPGGNKVVEYWGFHAESRGVPLVLAATIYLCIIVLTVLLVRRRPSSLTHGLGIQNLDAAQDDTDELEATLLRVDRQHSSDHESTRGGAGGRGSGVAVRSGGGGGAAAAAHGGTLESSQGSRVEGLALEAHGARICFRDLHYFARDRETRIRFLQNAQAHWAERPGSRQGYAHLTTSTVEDLEARQGPSSPTGAPPPAHQKPPRAPRRPGEVAEVHILQGLTGMALPGEMLAIMGPSGAGKTTMLEVMAGKKSRRSGRVEGDVFVNGRRWLAGETMAGLCNHAYVRQENAHLDLLTVRETVEFAVALRLELPSSTPPELRKKLSSLRVDMILHMLQLTSLEDMFVGRHPSKGGLSGGELKRLSIAVEVVNLPDVIFLDEPTSGLDSATAFEVACLMEQLASQNRTIVATIHQPSMRTFAVFNTLLLLSSGRCAYFGPLREAVPYFAQPPILLKYNHEKKPNPADFLVAAAGHTPTPQLVQAYQSSEACRRMVRGITDLLAGEEQITITPRSLDRARTTPVDQFIALTGRGFLRVTRLRGILVILAARHLLAGLLFGSLYRLDRTTATAQNTASLLFFSLVFAVLGHQKVLTGFFKDREVLLHEKSLKLYGSVPYFFARACLLWTIDGACVFIFCLVTYFMAGLYHMSSGFGFLVSIMFLTSITSLSLCQLVAALSPSAQSALAVFFPVCLFLTAFGGYLVLIPSLPPALDPWAPGISYIRWAFQALMLNQFSGSNEEDILETYGFEGHSKWISLLPLFITLGLLELLSLMAIRRDCQEGL